MQDFRKVPDGPQRSKNSRFRARLKISSEIEIFEQATHRGPIFVGKSRRRDWTFRARLNISIEIENFEWDLIFLIVGPSGVGGPTSWTYPSPDPTRTWSGPEDQEKKSVHHHHGTPLSVCHLTPRSQGKQKAMVYTILPKKCAVKIKYYWNSFPYASAISRVFTIIFLCKCKWEFCRNYFLSKLLRRCLFRLFQDIGDSVTAAPLQRGFGGDVCPGKSRSLTQIADSVLSGLCR